MAPNRPHTLIRLDVSIGSNSDLYAPKREVRIAPINGHLQRGAAGPISAISGSRTHSILVARASTWLR